MWDWFVNFLTSVLAVLASWTGDWGIAVIVLTIIIRLILVPLMTKQTASSAKMQALQPKMQAIQEKYADDPQKQAEELQKFYSEHKFNPVGGCLPVILQMPIFFGLFTVAKQVPSDASFLNFVPSLADSCKSMIASSGWGSAVAYIILVIFFGVFTLIPMLMNSKNTPEGQRSQMLLMGIIMSVMMVWIGWSLPAAVILYYDASAIWQVAQQKIVTQRVMDQVKAETEAKLEAQGQENQIDIVRREHKKRPHKKN
ncbi:MAG: YidC/Oxa1 family membrane protein insertase [Olegusella sp.]|jgi:YidC/Oxa1 family membrane protein insertase|nr:YidC/Oxa1 family membrane protein insertase [Olegusella sp.]MCI1933638.1 YidC/Oxa1 family membrane protein insertase [Atopobiaceae bacterium]